MKKIVFTLTLACLSIMTFAQWSNDASVNNMLYSGTASVYETKAATHAATGMTYINWFVLESGGMHPKLQMVDVYGEPQWADNGIYVSTHPNGTALFGTAFTTTSDGCAVVAFSDERQGGDMTPQAYKISPSGEFLWGADGIQLSTEYSLRTYLWPCNDGSVWAAWITESTCRARHISSDGQTLSPIITIGNEQVFTTFGHIIADDDNNMIMAYFVNTGNFMWPNREMYVVKYNTQGNPIWNAPTLLMVSTGMNFARDLELVPDGLGGGYTTVYIPIGNIHQAVAFHFDANGNATTPTSGIFMSSNGMVHNYSETITVDPITHNAIIAFITANTGETQRFISVQSIDVNGNKLWGEEGIALTTMGNNSIFDLSITAVPSGGAIVSFEETENIKAIRIDGNGQTVWEETVFVSTSPVAKDYSDQPSDVHNGQMIFAWVENGNSVKAQNLKLDGTLGPISGTEDPSVDILVGEVTQTTVEATFTPNESCASYIILIGIESEMQMWMQMMQATLEQLIQMWGLTLTGEQTYTWDEQTPNTEYTIYVLPLDAEGTTYEIQTELVTTLSGGGTGEALVTIELSEITETSVRMIVTPNDQTAVFYDGLISIEIFNQIGQDSAIEIIKNGDYPQYETDDWTWENLESNTTYKAIGIGKNADDEWGPATIDEFTTLGGTVECLPPTTVSTEIVNENDVMIQWNQADNAVGYIVLRDGETISTLPATSASYTDGNLAAGTYCYTIVTVCEDGGSEPSDESCKTIEEIIECLPPTNVTTEIVNENDVMIQWNQADNAVGYIVLRDGETITTLPATSTSYTDEDLASGTYCYTIVTVCEEGGSEPSDESCETVSVAISEENNTFISIYPNPTNNSVTISGENIESVSVYNIVGQNVENIKLTDNASINTAHYTSGIYIFKITTTDGKVISKRVVVEH